jgi:hypothetical protein
MRELGFEGAAQRVYIGVSEFSEVTMGDGSSDEKKISNPRTLGQKKEESSNGGCRKFRPCVGSFDENELAS